MALVLAPKRNTGEMGVFDLCGSFLDPAANRGVAGGIGTRGVSIQSYDVSSFGIRTLLFEYALAEAVGLGNGEYDDLRRDRFCRVRGGVCVRGDAEAGEKMEMNVVYASDNNFAEMLGISMISLFENNTECEEIVVYILDDNISDDNKNKLNSIGGKYNRKLVFIKVGNVLIDKMKQQRGSLSTFSRLYLQILLPDYIDKVIYLDCDILIKENIQTLYDLNISDYYCAGVNDCVSSNHLNIIGLNSDNCYFNAGVLLINLEIWRKKNIIEKFINFSERFDNDVPYADQGIINGVVSIKSMIIDIKYNCYTALFDFTYKDLMIFRKPSKYYSEKEVSAAKEKPAIVHFTTSFLSLRPWIEGCGHPYVSEWLRYKEMSPWADVPLSKDNRSVRKKVAVRIYRMLPKRIAVNLVGLLHAKIVPMIRRKKNGFNCFVLLSRKLRQ